MNHKITFLLSFIFLSFVLSAQITTIPEFSVADDSVKIVFDSSKENRLGFYAGELYAHTGVKIEEKNDWQHVIGTWGDNSQQPKLLNKGNGIYELNISPDINSYYSVADGEKVIQMAFVFRSADATMQTGDLFINVYQDDFVVEITEPAATIIKKNSATNIAAISSSEATLKLLINDVEILETSGTTVSNDYIFTTEGYTWVIAEAQDGDKIIRDSTQIFVRNEVTEMVKPSNYKTGINYPTNSSAALVLYAPFKEFVFVLGDFNSWEIQSEFQMNKDGDYFWLEIPNLEPGKEYIFQYLVDGEIKLADPYSEKILDPDHDKFISEETYPNLIAYPENKTEGIASVLQPGEEEFDWEIEEFQLPAKEKLVIYELLIRDFTEEHSFKAVREKLDYLEDLNINVLELLPVNEFEGNNSWGYNPSFYFATDKYYGPKNELKRLIDECHNRGIAVVIDMVLNHSYGQSPFVQLYMNNWTITPENPWYNVSSPNPVFSWGYDFDHEADVVKNLVDSVNSFWINEYKVDGFRFDFTKGFTNTPGDGSAYDAARIEILKRMADKIWEQKSDALVILEHLADNSEEKVLSDYGMLLWGNMNHNYNEASMGYNESNKSDLEWGLYDKRDWTEPNLITYMESHDEERLVYKNKTYGKEQGNYNTKELPVALNRIELNSVFFIPLPGPKMIWQFGELGYDYSINDCGNGTINNDCRTAPKPIVWDYTEDKDRTDLFQVMSKLNHLKQQYEEFSPNEYSYSLKDEMKWYSLSGKGEHVFGIGNFGVTEKSKAITFPTTGIWYEFFTKDSMNFSTTNVTFNLLPGEYRLYSTRKLGEPDITTDVKFLDQQDNLSVYPNPVHNQINIQSKNRIDEIYLLTINGKIIIHSTPIANNSAILNVNDLTPGIYLVKIICENITETKKILKN